MTFIIVISCSLRLAKRIIERGFQRPPCNDHYINFYEKRQIDYCVHFYLRSWKTCLNLIQYYVSSRVGIRLKLLSKKYNWGVSRTYHKLLWRNASQASTIDAESSILYVCGCPAYISVQKPASSYWNFLSRLQK